MLYCINETQACLINTAHAAAVLHIRYQMYSSTSTAVIYSYIIPTQHARLICPSVQAQIFCLHLISISSPVVLDMTIHAALSTLYVAPLVDKCYNFRASARQNEIG